MPIDIIMEVSKGFHKRLQLVGVGYHAAMGAKIS
jgi:ribosomal protein L6P/L9E